MANKIAGITLQINGDTTLLNKSLGEVNSKSKSLQTELKQVERLLKLDPTNTTLLAQKQEILSKSVGNTKDKLDKLKEAEKQVQQQFAKGDVSEEQYRALQREVVSTEESLKKLEKQAKQSNTALSASFEDAGSKLTSLGKKASIASAAIVAGVGVAAGAALEAADSYVKLSDETGLSLEALQEWGYVGGQVGVDIETIAGAQAKLTKSMAAARDGTGTQADAFKTLGISVVDANGNLRDVKDVMGEAFTALNGVGNETERDALSMSIFGKSAMDLNPLIKLGADGMEEMKQKAHDLGIVMDDETIKALDDFGDSTAGLQMSIMGAVAESLTPFIAKLTELVNWFSGLSEGTKGVILAIMGIVAVIGPLLMLLGMMATGIGTIITVFGAGGVAAGALGAAFAFLTGPIGWIILVIASLIAIGVALYQNWDQIKANAAELGTSISTTFNNIKTNISNAINGAKDAVSNAINAIKGFFNFTFSWPHIPLPHFSVTPSGWGAGDLLKGIIPSLGISWYDKGGIFNNPAIIGVGEKRPEFVGALDDLRYLIRDELKSTKVNSANSGGLVVRIENFNNARSQDVQAFAEELEFYRKQKSRGLGVG